METQSRADFNGNATSGGRVDVDKVKDETTQEFAQNNEVYFSYRAECINRKYQVNGQKTTSVREIDANFSWVAEMVCIDFMVS